MDLWRIPLADIDIGQEEKDAVLDVLDKKWLTMGEITAKFEREFSELIGVKKSFAVSNGTVALHMACLALGIGPGDEVIVPSLTFVATANAVMYTGAKPVFADIRSSDDLTISVDAIESCITEKTKAIIVMHYGGYPCSMREIKILANQHNLAVIEDAAHAPGAQLENILMGKWGDVGCFSFFSNKNMTTGEGGMVTTDREDLAEKFTYLRSHGMTSLTWDRHKGHAWSYDVVNPGYNYRTDEIHSALGRVQLKKLILNNAKRAELVKLYREAFQELLPQIEVPFMCHAGISAYHLMVMLLPKGIGRIQFMNGMKEFRIQTSVHYPPIHHFSYYKNWIKNKRVALPVTEDVASREVTLPLYPGMNPNAVEDVVKAIRYTYEKIDAEKVR